MRTRLRGTPSTAACTAIAVGKNTPSAMVASFEASPIPNHRIISGSSAIFGIGNSAETSGTPTERL